MARLTVRLEGMSCVHCVRAVTTALTGVGGITSADVRIGSAVIEHDGRATLEKVADAIAIAGYTVRDGSDERRVMPVMQLSAIGYQLSADEDCRPKAGTSDLADS